MTFQLVVGALKGELDKTIKEIQKPVFQAARVTMRETSKLAKQFTRASMAAGGLSTRFQNAVRETTFDDTDGDVTKFPTGFTWLRSTWGGIFQTGGEITGSPYLWIPITGNLPSGNKKWTPALFNELIGPLDFVQRPGKAPLLVGKVSVLKGGAKIRRQPNFANSARGARSRARFFVFSEAQKLPVFVGVQTVREPKLFDMVAAGDRALSTFEQRYAKNLSGLVD